MPYNKDVFDIAPTIQALEEGENCKILEAKTIEIQSNPINALRSALSDGFPVIIAARIFESFSDTLSGFVKHPTTDELNDENISHHAMVVCGFSDEEKVFVVRNSWGETFGDKGYCYIPYSYAEKYFLQACIITKLSIVNDKVTVDLPQTLNFDADDIKIKQAILRNLIEEDKLELIKLKTESDILKTDWSKNEGALVNVNTQTNIVDNICDKITTQIDETEKLKEAKENALDPNVRSYKKKFWRNVIYLSILSLFSWLFIYLFPKSCISWTIGGILTSFTIGYYAWARYQWKLYRRDLLDEIDSIAKEVNKLKESRRKMRVDSHIHGTILRKFIDLRNKFRDK